MTTGILLIDKPAGITSHDVIDRLRRITGIRTIGHAGTLDPFATGLLIVAVGKAATTTLQHYVGLEKEYLADIRLGETTDTFDPEGAVRAAPCPTITPDTLASAMRSLTGTLAQIPPMHAAIKVHGKKLYELAREGKEIVREPRAVTVHEFTLLAAPTSLALPATFSAKIHCSSGTYIRALARDLGEALHTAGYLTALRRTAIGTFHVDKARKLEELSQENWIDCLRSPVVA